jgi:hypothetical protein
LKGLWRFCRKIIIKGKAGKDRENRAFIAAIEPGVVGLENRKHRLELV